MTAAVCTCGHLELGHDIGTRKGARVRTRCLHQSSTGVCRCKQFTPREGDPE